MDIWSVTLIAAAAGAVAGWILSRTVGNTRQNVRVRELEIRAETMTEEIRGLREEQVKAIETAEGLRRDLVEVTEKKAGFESKLGELQQAVRDWQNRYDQKEKHIADLILEIASLKESRATLETRIQETTTAMKEQRRLLDEAESKFRDVFQALAGEVLRSSSSEFLQLAQERLTAIGFQAKGDLDSRKQEISSLLQPLSDALQRYREELARIEQQRQQAYGSLTTTLQSVAETHKKLQSETTNLVNALRRPQVKGRWGEITLQRVVELAGMSEYCDFDQQVWTKTEEGILRPDMVVHLPNNRSVVVDAKVPLNAYLEATTEGVDEAARSQLIRQHAKQVREHISTLSSKAYWNQFPSSPDFVVMFLPGDPFLGAALESDHSLIEDAIASRVLLATPTTLVAVLRAIAYGWKQEQLARNAQKIADEGKMVFERLAVFWNHLDGVRKNLELAVESFNRAARSWDSRILPSARRLKELGASGPDKDVDSIEPIEHTPQQLSMPEEE